ncbi:hypothetical protein ACEWY4_027547 [Coilia grayii]|uniref:Mapk-regulated corepressor-interacting protein 1 n=1 Tax=Coilia grayii TaxID=363190 RepID=A0ABD1IRJ9_9TELE
MTSSSTPRMVNTYKRTASPRSPTNSAELYTPAHEENVRFIHDTWMCVLKEIKSPQNERNERGPQEYVEKNPNPNLHSFTPIDLSDLKKRNTQDAKKSVLLWSSVSQSGAGLHLSHLSARTTHHAPLLLILVARQCWSGFSGWVLLFNSSTRFSQHTHTHTH